MQIKLAMLTKEPFLVTAMNSSTISLLRDGLEDHVSKDRAAKAPYRESANRRICNTLGHLLTIMYAVISKVYIVYSRHSPLDKG